MELIPRLERTQPLFLGATFLRSASAGDDTARDASVGPPSGTTEFVCRPIATSSLAAFLIVPRRDSRVKKRRGSFAVSPRVGDTQRLRVLESLFRGREELFCCRDSRGCRFLSCLALRQRFVSREGDRLVTKRHSLIHVGISDTPG